MEILYNELRKLPAWLESIEKTPINDELARYYYKIVIVLNGIRQEDLLKICSEAVLSNDKVEIILINK